MTRPNLLLVVPDGMQAQTTFPESPCRTPNVDRIAERGLRFRRAYTVQFTCSPARASLMTGVLPHNHGVLQVEHTVDDDQCVLRTEYPHWAQRLGDAGYRTAYFGKWHIERSNDLRRFGWQEGGSDHAAAQRALGAGVTATADLLDGADPVRYDEGPEGYRPVLHYAATPIPTERRPFVATTRAAQEFLESAAAGDAPWACCVSFAEPNVPLVANRDAYLGYDLDAIDLPASLGDTFADSPAIYRRQREVFGAIGEREWRQARAVYYALIGELDAQVGALLDQLERLDVLDDTIVVFMSDHGRYVGAHGFDAHNFGAFEEAYRIPLVIAGPGVAGPGVVADSDVDAVVSLVDVAPTLLELTGAAPIDAPDCRSFADLLRDPVGAAARHDSAYAESCGNRFLMTQRILWQGTWKFVFNGFDYDELYDLATDPDELVNLGADPRHAQRRRDMMVEIWRRARATGDQSIVDTHYAPMRIAAVGPEI